MFCKIGPTDSKIVEAFKGNIENKYLDRDWQKNFNVVDERWKRFNRFLSD